MKLTIQKLGINGEGIAYLDKKPVFIDGALPEEIVEASIIQKDSKYYRAKIDHIIKKSKDRVRPQCPYQKECGGCSLMHLKYEKQAYYKKQLLTEALWKYGHVKENFVRDIHTDENVFGYRSACKLPVSEENGKLVTGMYKPGTNHFVSIDTCIVQSEAVESLRKNILHVLNNHHMHAFDKNKNTGLRYLFVRSIQGHGQCALITGNDVISKEIVDALMQIDGLECLAQSINTNRKSVSIFGKETKVLAGSSTIPVVIDEIELQLSCESFFQLNIEQAINLYHMAINKVDKCHRLVEGYCGIGAMSLLANKKADTITGIEVIPEAIKNAKINASRNHLEDHIEFITDDAGKGYIKVLKKGEVDTLLIDPPRSGIDEDFLKTILKYPPKRIVYISCNPSTLSKNLKVLKQYYQVRTVIPYDLFPNTPHVESVTVLTK